MKEHLRLSLMVCQHAVKPIAFVGICLDRFPKCRSPNWVSCGAGGPRCASVHSDDPNCISFVICVICVGNHYGFVCIFMLSERNRFRRPSRHSRLHSWRGSRYPIAIVRRLFYLRITPNPSSAMRPIQKAFILDCAPYLQPDHMEFTTCSMPPLVLCGSIFCRA